MNVQNTAQLNLGIMLLDTFSPCDFINLHLLLYRRLIFAPAFCDLHNNRSFRSREEEFESGGELF